MKEYKKYIVKLAEGKEKAGEHLQAEDIVDAARPSSSPLHSAFCWDDTQAAHLYRIEQARHLIRLCVHTVTVERKVYEVPVFQSLTTDRKQPGGGYRLTVDILNAQHLKAQMLVDAANEMRIFISKYGMLKELASVRSAMRKALGSLNAKIPKLLKAKN